jgi:hypothetical protein
MGDALDEGLEILGNTGPEYQAFEGRFSFANHGPMVIEALSAMGRDDAIVEWSKRYAPRLDEPPPGRERITVDNWWSALGEMSRVRDWREFFAQALTEAPWADVLEQWVPRLAPGMVGSIHGAIRTAHAVRGLGDAETTARIRELGEGLAYWSAGYRVLTKDDGGPGDLLPSQAVGQLEQLDLANRTGWRAFTDPIGKLADVPSFSGVAGLIDWEHDPSATTTDLARTFALILISNNAAVNPRALCHGLTAGTLYRIMSPALSTEAGRSILRHGWQTAAAFYCAIVLEPPAETCEPPGLTVEEVIDEAMACPDEHGIKVTDVCLREYEIEADPVFLAAAICTTRRLNEVGLNLY